MELGTYQERNQSHTPLSRLVQFGYLDNRILAKTMELWIGIGIGLTQANPPLGVVVVCNSNKRAVADGSCELFPRELSLAFLF
jgi:hypothetical protein